MEYEYDTTITILLGGPEKEDKDGTIPYQLGVPPSKRVAEGNAAAVTSYLT